MRRQLLLLAALSAGYAQTVPNIRVDVNLVTLAASVSDRNGAPVQNLHREDFVLFDNAEPREIKYLWQEMDLPLTVGLIADVSGSQSGLVGKHRQTITQFLRQVIGPRDRAFIVTVVRRMVPPLARSRARFVELKAGQQIRGILLKMFRPGVISAETYTLSQYATAIVNRIVVVSLPKMV